MQRSFNASAPILICDDGENTSVSVQDFLIGTAACELPPDWPDDAILAQMVAAHSYVKPKDMTVRRMALFAPPFWLNRSQMRSLF